ncbi:hypothetical protein [Microbacter margulisiae]|uniref:Uncharacterized protein n=1 Tax=Microbacter margulisiae TaxID=1350067 RepID=A0A7W5DSN1_9PORP|nr:hypothetical protein [Microbacter margulisiae]MBB3188352.1 hypothetical protein [Microbacter margulisiae]
MEAAVGGWTPFSTQIPADVLDVFKKSFAGFVGVTYSPLAYASQVVAGTNYQFFCNAKGVYPGAANEAAMVTIYKPLQGDPHITSIHKV